MLPRSLLALLALAPFAAADILQVPGDADSIQAAVDLAHDGDTIIVHKHAWTEPVVIDGLHNLVLQGAGQPKIDLSGLGQAAGITVSSSTHITVSGLRVVGATLAGILVSDSSDVLVERCRVTGITEDWPEAGIRVAGGSEVVLDRNKIDNFVVGIRFYNDGDPEATDCTLTRNVVHELWHACIELRGSDHVAEKNVLHDATDDGIFCDASNTTLRQNKIRDVDAGLTVFSGDGNTLDRNKVGHAGSYGIHVTLAASDTHLTGNRIVKSGTIAGLFLESTSTTCEGDRITRATDEGVRLEGGTIELTDVRVAHAAGHGFRVGTDSNIFTSCRAMKCGDDGFHVTGTLNEFTGCKGKGNDGSDMDLIGEMNELIDCDFGTIAN